MPARASASDDEGGEASETHSLFLYSFTFSTGFNR